MPNFGIGEQQYSGGAEKQVGQTEQHLNQIVGGLDELFRLMTVAESRFGPACRPSPGEGVNAAAIPKRVSSPLANQLEEIASKVNVICKRLSAFNESCDL